MVNVMGVLGPVLRSALRSWMLATLVTVLGFAGSAQASAATPQLFLSSVSPAGLAQHACAAFDAEHTALDAALDSDLTEPERDDEEGRDHSPARVPLSTRFLLVSRPNSACCVPEVYVSQPERHPGLARGPPSLFSRS